MGSIWPEGYSLQIPGLGQGPCRVLWEEGVVLSPQTWNPKNIQTALFFVFKWYLQIWAESTWWRTSRRTSVTFSVSWSPCLSQDLCSHALGRQKPWALSCLLHSFSGFTVPSWLSFYLLTPPSLAPRLLPGFLRCSQGRLLGLTEEATVC